MVRTNVYCALCEGEVGRDDSFVVERPDIVQALHFNCGNQISVAMAKAIGSTPAPAREFVPPLHDPTQHETMAAWKMRETEDRLDALEDLTRRVASVWRLWLNDAETGSINPSTFDGMKALLGIEK